MRKAIVYASVHHGNTEKLVKGIAEECQDVYKRQIYLHIINLQKFQKAIMKLVEKYV